MRSVLEQSFADLEVVVVDDASSTPLDHFGDPRVSVLRHEPSRGVAAARNTGIAHTSGEWIAFLDDDDLWHPDKLALQLAAATAEDANFVYTSTEVIAPDGRLLQRRAAPDAAAVSGELERYNVVGGPSSVMVKRELLGERDPFFPGLSIVADWDLWLRLRSAARYAAVPRSLVAVMEHAGSMQIEGASAIQGELEVLRERHPVLLDESNAARHLSSMRLWVDAKRWQSDPTLGTGTSMIRAASAHHGVRGAVNRILRRSAVRREPKPEWLVSALRGQRIQPVPAPPAFGPEMPAARVAAR